KPKVDKDKALELHIQLAEGDIQNNNRESARHHLRRAFDIDRNSVEATAVMARLYEMEGELELAEEHYLRALRRDRKSTRLNSSHVKSSYAVFCLKKKTTMNMPF